MFLEEGMNGSVRLVLWPDGRKLQGEEKGGRKEGNFAPRQTVHCIGKEKIAI